MDPTEAQSLASTYLTEQHLEAVIISTWVLGTNNSDETICLCESVVYLF